MVPVGDVGFHPKRKRALRDCAGGLSASIVCYINNSFSRFDIKGDCKSKCTTLELA